MRPSAGAAFYRVVVNREGCYCVWPTDRAVPVGWRSTGFCGPIEVALNQVAELWRGRHGWDGGVR